MPLWDNNPDYRLTMNYQAKKIGFTISLTMALLCLGSPVYSYTSLLYKGCEQGNNVEKTEERDFPTLNILEVSGDIRLNVVSNQTRQFVKITGDENLLPLIATSISGNKLLVHATKPICTEIGITLDISLGELTALVSTTSGEVKASELYTSKFSLVAEGSGDIELTGYAESFTAVINGTGDLESRGLRTADTTMNITGSSSSNVTASKSLRVSIVGIADVYYSGNPEEVHEDIIGAGSLNRIE